MDDESKSLITLPVLREFLDALPSAEDRDRIVDALLTHETHWSVIAQAHDAGVIKPLTSDQFDRVGRVRHPDAALWATAAHQSAAGLGSLHRLVTLARLINTDEENGEDDALGHLATGKPSAVMHSAEDLGLDPSTLRKTYFASESLFRISEVGLALMYRRIKGAAWTNVSESISDMLLPVVAFGTSKRSTAYTVADVAAGCPRMARALTRSRISHRDAEALRTALEARMAHMVATSEQRPRSAGEMQDMAAVLMEFAAAGVLPSKGMLAQEIQVRTVEPANAWSDVERKASRLPFVDAFTFWQDSLSPATADSARGNHHGSLWTYFAASRRLDALRHAVDAGFVNDSPGSLCRPINAALAMRKVDPELLSYLVAQGLDEDPIFLRCGDPSAPVMLSAARAMHQLTGASHAPLPAL